MSDLELRQTLQRVTSIVEAKVSDYVKKETGKDPVSAGISPNTIARDFVSSQYIRIRKSAHQSPLVEELKQRSVNALTSGDTVLAEALESDRISALNEELSQPLKSA